MKQEDKELLLKDICARLPYGVKGLAYIVGEPCNINTNINGVFNGAINKSIVTDYETPMLELIDLSSKDITIKPYLRPMSSMTKDERKDWFKYSCVDYDCEFKPEPTLYVGYCHLSVDWLNAHHFDYRGLIEKGLALEAPKEMYKTVL